MNGLTCHACGVPLTGRQTKWCVEHGTASSWQARYLAEHGEYQSTAYRREHGRPSERTHPITCEWCGRDALVTKASVRFCSLQCLADKRTADFAASKPERLAARRAAAMERMAVVPRATLDPRLTLKWRQAERRLAAAARGPKRGKAVYVGGTCRRCGAAFVVMLTNSSPEYCSRECSRSDEKARRRAAKRDAFVAPVRRFEIFERDGWRCRICAKPVRRDVVVPDPLAPVLDHIVPLAAGRDAGGVHAPHNVQTAHFMCNSVKGASLAQPALF